MCVWQKRGRGCGRAYSGGYLGQRRGEGVSEGGKGVAEGGSIVLFVISAAAVSG